VAWVWCWPKPGRFIVLAAHHLPSQRSQGYIAQKKRVAHIESLIRGRPQIGVNALFGGRPNILPGPVDVVGMADRGESQSEAKGKLRGLTEILEKIDERSGERTCQNFRLAWFCTRLPIVAFHRWHPHYLAFWPLRMVPTGFYLIRVRGFSYLFAALFWR